MIPHTREALGFILQRLLTSTVSELKTPYAMADVGLITQLLRMLGQDYERAVAARMQDIHELRALFEQAGFTPDGRIKAHMREAAALPLTDLHVSKLDAALDTHLNVLIELHEHVEARAAGNQAASNLDAAIWQFLERHAERHRYDVEAG